MTTLSLVLGWVFGFATGFFFGGWFVLKQFDKQWNEYNKSTQNLIDFYELMLNESIIKYNKLRERLDRGYEADD
jgi:uncharacterized protein YneF (UPF0154 family)